LTDLSIVIPTYRGSQSVPRLLEGLWAQPFPSDLEVIIVDDGSGVDEVRSLSDWMDQHPPRAGTVSLVELARNFGEHNAVMAGLERAQGDAVITMDDDLQHRPEDALRLYLTLAADAQVDVVYGQLVAKKHAAWRNIGSRFTDALLDRLVGKPSGVRLSTFRCIRGEVVRELVRYRGPFPYVDGLIIQRTNRITGLPVTHLARESGRSGYDLRRLISLFLSVATGFSVMPLRLILVLGSVVGASGLGAAAYAMIEWIRWGTIPGWTSIFVAVTLLSSVQLLMLGLVGEYLGRVLLTVNGRPQHAVRSVKVYGELTRGDAPKVRPAVI
jgi:glycosyltransferase involved in cell wall biosynthesis